MAISQFRARRSFLIVASLALPPSEYRKTGRARQCKCCKSAPETDDDSRRTRLVGSRLREQSSESEKRRKSQPQADAAKYHCPSSEISARSRRGHLKRRLPI